MRGQLLLLAAAMLLAAGCGGTTTMVRSLDYPNTVGTPGTAQLRVGAFTVKREAPRFTLRAQGINSG